MNSTKDGQPNNLEWALAYAAAGYRVLRVYGTKGKRCGCRIGAKCRAPGKHPVGKDWTSKATTDETTIRKWFEKRPDYNIGIATGVDSGIIVVDDDPRNGGNDSWRDLAAMVANKRPTPQQQSGGGGGHFVFRHPGGYVKSVNGVLPGIDIKADVGMFIVEPSQHASGGQYRWVEGRSLLEVKPTEFPAEWLFLLNGKSPSVGLQGCDAEHAEYPDNPGPSKEYPRHMYASSPAERDEPTCSADVSGEQIDQIIERTLPRRKGYRHKALFSLTRELVGLFGDNGLQTHGEDIALIVHKWYSTALERKLTTGTHTLEDCLERVAESWDKVKIPGGRGVLEMAAEAALHASPHPACLQIPLCTGTIRFFIGICVNLASRSEDGVFFVSVGDAVDLLSANLRDEKVDNFRVSRILKTLIKYRVLRIVKPGGRRPGDDATVYQFIGGR
jgi:hypothetical protein